MNKKKIDISQVTSELQGSVFFRPPAAPVEPDRKEGPEEPSRPLGIAPSRQRAVTTSPGGAVTRSRHHDSPLSRRHDSADRNSRDEVAGLTEAVSELGTKKTTYRFSPKEKAALREIIHAYERREIFTTENVVTRIGLNWLLTDYQVQGEGSILARVISRLHDQTRREA